MSKNLICLILLLAFCMVSPVQAANIIWVSGFFDDNGDGEPDDQAWVDMLEALGYTVDYTPGWEDLDDDKIAALNAADLIIVSRCSNSGDYDDNDEIAQWNSITTPIIQSSTHLIRSSRWLWFNTTSLTNLSDAVVDISASSHPIFAGVSSPTQVTDGVVGPSSFVDLAGVGAGNGTLLANVTGSEVAWIVEWEEGVEFYPGSGQFAGGPRMFFAAGTQESAPDIGRGEFNLTPDGEKVFFNAVRYMIGGSKLVKAGNPVPADGSFTEDTWVNLSWSPGESAVSHDVYLGDNFDDVNNGAEGMFIGNQAETFIVAGFPGFPYPDGLAPGTTYYWRIDEVNDAEPNSPWKGNIWSFTIPPKTAYLPDPADNAESIDLNASFSWTAGFGAKLHTVYFGDNYDDVNNATVGLPQGTPTFSPGPMELAKTYYWRVDEFDGIGTHKGNVWSFITEGAVAALKPVNGAVDVTQTPVLTWSPGLGASHEVYFGNDAASLELKGSGSLGNESFEPGQLEWNTTYYWRVDEADNANADSPWIGPLWSFTTANFMIVDDMESYNDINEGEPGSNRMYLAWMDGFDNPAINGSLVGNDPPPIAEQSIVHDGSQSMPLFYNNAVGKSEATLSLTSNRDWTVNGINTLTIWFRGDAGNAAENLYAALNGNAVVNHDNPNAAQIGSWTQWNIDLQAFADQGVNLTNVNSITLGLGNPSNPVAGGSGVMYYDDIRLYAIEPATP
ncbi:MAG: hypothetical protein GY845_17280 [Planctomycetes bacterium]|nr:hypothetical protein [Planctomycetota bacterium]